MKDQLNELSESFSFIVNSLVVYNSSNTKVDEDVYNTASALLKQIRNQLDSTIVTSVLNYEDFKIKRPDPTPAVKII